MHAPFPVLSVLDQTFNLLPQKTFHFTLCMTVPTPGGLVENDFFASEAHSLLHHFPFTPFHLSILYAVVIKLTISSPPSSSLISVLSIKFFTTHRILFSINMHSGSYRATTLNLSSTSSCALKYNPSALFPHLLPLFPVLLSGRSCG